MLGKQGTFYKTVRQRRNVNFPFKLLSFLTFRRPYFFFFFLSIRLSRTLILLLFIPVICFASVFLPFSDVDTFFFILFLFFSRFSFVQNFSFREFLFLLIIIMIFGVLIFIFFFSYLVFKIHFIVLYRTLAKHTLYAISRVHFAEH